MDIWIATWESGVTFGYYYIPKRIQPKFVDGEKKFMGYWEQDIAFSPDDINDLGITDKPKWEDEPVKYTVKAFKSE